MYIVYHSLLYKSIHFAKIIDKNTYKHIIVYYIIFVQYNQRGVKMRTEAQKRADKKYKEKTYKT